MLMSFQVLLLSLASAFRHNAWDEMRSSLDTKENSYHCVFAPGAGVVPKGENEVKYYDREEMIAKKNWMLPYTTYCATAAIPIMNTNDYKYDNEEQLHEPFCRAALKSGTPIQKGSASEVTNTLIFTLSFGNFYIAEAFMKMTYCKKGATTFIYSGGASFYGVPFFDWSNAGCQQATYQAKFIEMNLCSKDGKGGRPSHHSISFNSLRRTGAADKLVKWANQNVEGALCGNLQTEEAKKGINPLFIEWWDRYAATCAKFPDDELCHWGINLGHDGLFPLEGCKMTTKGKFENFNGKGHVPKFAIMDVQHENTAYQAKQYQDWVLPLLHKLPVVGAGPPARNWQMQRAPLAVSPAHPKPVAGAVPPARTGQMQRGYTIDLPFAGSPAHNRKLQRQRTI